MSKATALGLMARGDWRTWNHLYVIAAVGYYYDAHDAPGPEYYSQRATIPEIEKRNKTKRPK